MRHAMLEARGATAQSYASRAFGWNERWLEDQRQVEIAAEIALREKYHRLLDKERDA